MIDNYTRIVLTVIAGALVCLAGERALSPASAQSTGCGILEKPCFVAVGYVGIGDKYFPCHVEAPCAKR